MRANDTFTFGMPLRRDHNDPSKWAPTGGTLSFVREELKEMMFHVQGAPGSGKTATFITPFFVQAGNQYDLHDGGQLQKQAVRDSVTFFDLGGDASAFFAAKYIAEITGRKFWVVSIDFNQSCWVNLFDGLCGRSNTTVRWSNVMMASLRMNAGLDGGSDQFFSYCALETLQNAHRELKSTKAGAPIRLRDLVAWINTRATRENKGLQTMVQQLSLYPQLDPPPGARPVLNVKEALENGDFIYFWCPAIGEAMTASIIASLGLELVLDTAIQTKGTRSGHCWIVCDEFQTIIGPQMAQALALARKFGISFILANQDRAQLGPELMSVVSKCCRMKLHFTPSSKEDFEHLLQKSKDQTRSLSGTTYGQSVTHRSQDYIGTVLQRNDILELAARKRTGIFINGVAGEHVEPMPLETNFAVSQAFHEQHKTQEPPIVEKPVPALARESVDLVPRTAPSFSDTSQRHGAPANRTMPLVRGLSKILP